MTQVALPLRVSYVYNKMNKPRKITSHIVLTDPPSSSGEIPHCYRLILDPQDIYIYDLDTANSSVIFQAL